jgi:hypothetical protein
MTGVLHMLTKFQSILHSILRGHVYVNCVIGKRVMHSTLRGHMCELGQVCELCARYT